MPRHSTSRSRHRSAETVPNSRSENRAGDLYSCEGPRSEDRPLQVSERLEATAPSAAAAAKAAAAEWSSARRQDAGRLLEVRGRSRPPTCTGTSRPDGSFLRVPPKGTIIRQFGVVTVPSTVSQQGMMRTFRRRAMRDQARPVRQSGKNLRARPVVRAAADPFAETPEFAGTAGTPRSAPSANRTARIDSSWSGDCDAPLDSVVLGRWCLTCRETEYHRYRHQAHCFLFVAS